jgi:hypothetical protein
MTDGALFSTDAVPDEARFHGRLWVADLLDLTSAGLMGWGALRALEQERTAATLGLAVALVWLVLSAVGGWTGRTLGRQVMGVRLVRGERAPGLGRGLLRAFTAPVELPLQAVLQRRPLDAALGVRAERLPRGVGAWVKGLGPQLPWVALLAGAAWFLVTPTKQEMLTYLDRTLTGWRCCHGTREETWQCRTSLARVVRNARSGDEDARKVVSDCPVAAERLKP